MKKPLIIFGAGDIAQLADYYFSRDSDYKVVAFTVDADYITEKEFCGRPVIAFGEVARVYPPKNHDLFVALSYSKINAVRKEKYIAAKARGYSLASYISSHATLLNEGKIGDNCFIFEDNTIQPFVTIGNNVTLWSGNHIGHHSVIQDHCFIASHVVVSGGCTIGDSTFIGVNATLRDHITIGKANVIGAGALIMGNTEDNKVYIATVTEASKVPSNRLKRI